MGEQLLDAFSSSMAAFHERWRRRAPGAVRTRLLDDELLVCVMGNVSSDVENTLIEVGSAGHVRKGRRTFSHAMSGIVAAEAERLSGRPVVWSTSESHVGPDLQVDVFLLGPMPPLPEPQ